MLWAFGGLLALTLRLKDLAIRLLDGDMASVVERMSWTGRRWRTDRFWILA